MAAGLGSAPAGGVGRAIGEAGWGAGSDGQPRPARREETPEQGRRGPPSVDVVGRAQQAVRAEDEPLRGPHAPGNLGELGKPGEHLLRVASPRLFGMREISGAEPVSGRVLRRRLRWGLLGGKVVAARSWIEHGTTPSSPAPDRPCTSLP